MDEIAERGFCSTLEVQKQIPPQPNVFDDWLNSVRELIENPDTECD